MLNLNQWYFQAFGVLLGDPCRPCPSSTLAAPRWRRAAAGNGWELLAEKDRNTWRKSGAFVEKCLGKKWCAGMINLWKVGKSPVFRKAEWCSEPFSHEKPPAASVWAWANFGGTWEMAGGYGQNSHRRVNQWFATRSTWLDTHTHRRTLVHIYIYIYIHTYLLLCIISI